MFLRIARAIGRNLHRTPQNRKDPVGSGATRALLLSPDTDARAPGRQPRAPLSQPPSAIGPSPQPPRNPPPFPSGATSLPDSLSLFYFCAPTLPWCSGDVEPPHRTSLATTPPHSSRLLSTMDLPVHRRNSSLRHAPAEYTTAPTRFPSPAN
jgi:hypothetical protein